jgi:hypothetical protein
MIFRVIGRLTVRFFKGLGKMLFAPVKWFGKHPVGGIFSLAIVAGLVTLGIYTSGFGLGGLFDGNKSSSLVVSPEPSVPPSGGSSLVLSGLAEFNAAKIWDGMNPDYRAQFEKDGFNVANMQLAIDEAKKSVLETKGEVKYNGFELRGVNAIPRTGGKLETYLGSTQFNETVTRYIYQLQLDKDGKVTAISNPEGEPDPIMTAAFRKPKTKEDNAPQSGTMTGKQSVSTEQIMAGLTTFDPDKVWKSLSPDFQKALGTQQQKVSLDSMKKTFEQIKKEISASKQVIGYNGYVFRYSYEFPNGTVYSVYVSVLQIGGTAQETEYAFLLDKAGTIVSISTNDQILNSILGRAQE